jgi:Acetyltransferase (GNAT) domain
MGSWREFSDLGSLLSSPKSSTQGHSHFFLGRFWAEYYLLSWPVQERIGLVVFDAPSGECFAALSKAIGRSKLGLSLNSIGFNESSSEKLKFVTPEINGLYLLDSMTSEIDFTNYFAQTVSMLSAKFNDWDEIRLGALPANFALSLRTWAAKENLGVVEVDIKRTYQVNLSDLRARKINNYIESRSSNTRAQLRKAKRFIENSMGEIHVEKAGSLEQLRDWFESLKLLHKARWRDTADGSGFASDTFNEFQDSLADRAFAQGLIDVWRVKAGSTVLAYLHFFTNANKAYFNISGINYDVPNACRPGLVSHWLVIQQYLDVGFDQYDFMVGTSQYKESLSTDTSNLHFLTIRKKSLAFLIETQLRQAKRFLRKTSA